VADGRFTPENYRTLQLFTMPDCGTPGEVVRHHGDGWHLSPDQGGQALVLPGPRAAEATAGQHHNAGRTAAWVAQQLERRRFGHHRTIARRTGHGK